MNNQQNVDLCCSDFRIANMKIVIHMYCWA